MFNFQFSDVLVNFLESLLEHPVKLTVVTVSVMFTGTFCKVCGNLLSSLGELPVKFFPRNECSLMPLTPTLFRLFFQVCKYLTGNFLDEHFGAGFGFLCDLGAEIQNLFYLWCFRGRNGRKRPGLLAVL